MNSFFNISSGFTGCYKENQGSFNESVNYTVPQDIWQNDITVIEDDFYSTKYEVEVPTSQFFQRYGNLGTNADEPKFKAFTEFDFSLHEYTNIKNIILEYQLDAIRTNGIFGTNKLANSIVRYRQSEYCLLDFIENIEVNLGSNKLTINRYMQDTMAIKSYLQTMEKDEKDMRIAGKLGLSTNYPINNDKATLGNSNIGLSNEIQKDVWKGLMDAQLPELEKNNYVSMKVSVPLYMIVPFFNQELAYLPRGMPINIKINWRIDTRRAKSSTSWASWLFGSDNNKINQNVDVYGGINYILNGGEGGNIEDRNGPRIVYLTSRLTKMKELDASLVMKSYTYNYNTFILKQFPIDNTPSNITSYIATLGTNQELPLEMILSVFMDNNAQIWSSPVNATNTVITNKPLSNINFRCPFVEVRGNGSLIKSLGRTDPNFLILGSLEESEWCIERLLAVENDSDTSYQNVIANFGTCSQITGTPYQVCLASGGIYKRMLRPNVDGVTNIEVNYGVNDGFGAALSPTMYYINRIYLKYLTQLLVDDKFQITLVNNPAISI